MRVSNLQYTVKYLIFGQYVKVRDPLCIRILIWVNISLNHIDTTAIILRYEGFLHVVYTRMASKKNIPKHPYFTGVKKKVKSSLNILKLFKTQDDIGATLVATDHLHEMSKDHTTPS